MKEIQLIECPRDAMQGWKVFIPTEKKIEYLNELMKVGFHTLDFGSFVSPKAIPQMADTKEVLSQLDTSGTNTKLLAIVANKRGADDAVAYSQVSYLGFPFSISPTFQLRNTNSNMSDSFETVLEIQKLCKERGKELVIYLSMGFGNPYGDEYNESILLQWAGRMVDAGITIISLADTVGMATPEQITLALSTLIPQHPEVTFGVHLHSTAANWKSKLKAAIDAGCIRIDGALKGIGGCPMAGNDLVGNMNTEYIISYLEENKMAPRLNQTALKQSLALANAIFS
jgi:hydroxymethylglutaryl-CoA lyase